MLTQERVKELMTYCPQTGVFRWRVSPHEGITAGRIAGWNCIKGYYRIGIDGRKYDAHRLAWLYVYGAWPKCMLDPINGDGKDNRIVNLREANNSQNQRNRGACKNSTSKHKGVSFQKSKGKFRAYCQINNDKKYIGIFLDEADAATAYNLYLYNHDASNREFHRYNTAQEII